MTECRAISAEEFLPIASVAEKYGVTNRENCLRFIDTQWDKIYDVWLLQGDQGKLILKKDKKRKGDKAVYDTYFAGHDFAVAGILDAIPVDDDLYIVMEYADGTDARNCTVQEAARIGHELARIQRTHLRCGGHTDGADHYFSAYVEDCWKKIKDHFPGSGQVFQTIRERFFSAPHTLIHDDLLPINVLLSEEAVWIIDWETSGILPYFLDFARFAFVEGGNHLFYISAASAMAFLDACFEGLRDHELFGLTKEAFLRDVAISAFCQYAMFLYYADEETICESADFRFMQEILAYLGSVK